MNHLAIGVGRVLLTLLIVGCAVVAVVLVWRHYEDEPWTRDGRLSADVVQVSADVSGLVTRVLVHDNQPVRVGDVLFVVDRERYTAQLAQAEAAIDNAVATLDNDRREAARYNSLGDLVSREVRDQRLTAVRQAQAQLEQMRANRRLAAINLDRSAVRARVNGHVTGFSMRPGNYVSAGSPLFALVDTDSYYVLGYFEETKLRRFAIGDRAQVTLLGDDRPILGHVESLAAGIADREQSQSGGLLPNVNPTFSWIRLAQRVPVRVAIDSVPPGQRLVIGRTATVSILPRSGQVVHRADPRTASPANSAPAPLRAWTSSGVPAARQP